MARPKKQGFDYFPFDVDLYQDYKVRKLMRHQGGSQAITVYTLLLCNIYRNGYYMRWDEELPFFMSETLGLKEAYIKAVISDCAVIGLINKELYDKEGIITSEGIQRRYLYICQQTRRTSAIKDYSLLPKEEEVSSAETLVSSAETLVSSAETLVSSAETLVSSAKSTQKKRKEKKSSPSSPPSDDVGLRVEGEEEEGGGVFDFGNKAFEVLRARLGKVGVEEADQWEFQRLMTARGVDADVGRKAVDKYTSNTEEQRRAKPFYSILRLYQDYECKGMIKPVMSQADFQAQLYIYTTFKPADRKVVFDSIYANPICLAELKERIAEIKRKNSGIKHPAQYILAGMKKLTTTNHERD